MFDGLRNGRFDVGKTNRDDNIVWIEFTVCGWGFSIAFSMED